MKLQDAYVAETNGLGTWVVIGYKEPGGTNFTYAGGNVEPATTCANGGTYNATTKKCIEKDAETGADKDGTITGSSITEGWTAENKVKLNDCDAGVNWKISAATGLASSNTGSVTYTNVIGDEANCGGLTPHFKAIGQ